MTVKSRKRLLDVGTGVVLTLMLVACGQTSEGRGEWAPEQAAKPIESADAEKLLLDENALVEIIGANVTASDDREAPEDDSTLARCDVMRGPGQVAYVGENYIGFRSRVARDSADEDLTHYALHVAIVYDDPEAAKSALNPVAAQMAACDGWKVQDEDGDLFQSTLDRSTDDQLVWTLEQQGDVVAPWQCFGEARVRANAVLRGLTCRGDKDGRPDTEQLLNRMSDAVWRLSAPNGDG